MPLIRCLQYTFPISDPFLPGHSLSPEEAQALNALRAENIRNNLAQQVRKKVDLLEPGQLLPPAALEELGEIAARYDREYQFGIRRAYSREGPIEAEAKEIAKGLVLARAKADGRSISVEDLPRLIEEASKEPEVLAEARQRVEEHQRVATGALESLL